MGAELMWTCPHFLLSITESYWMCFVEENGFRINNEFTLENKVGSVWDSPLEIMLVFCLLLHATVCCSIL